MSEPTPSADPATFERLAQLAKEENEGAVLDALIDDLRARGAYHELFEALKMRIRRDLGLPLLYNDTGDDLDESRRQQLEDRLIEACREIGLALLEAGRVREGWTYLRPVGDKKAAAERLAKIEPTDENAEDLIQVYLHEGIDPAAGFRLMLDRYGTCNSVTTLDGVAYTLSPQALRQVAGILVRHMHEELTENVRGHIARKEGQLPQESTLGEILAARPDLLAGGAYHIDTSHLAATMRHAQCLEDPEALRLALELAEYGQRLDSQLQYAGEEPFVKLYPSHALYFRALLGEDVEKAVDYFGERAESVDRRTMGSAAAEVYVDLLGRLGRYDEAITARLKLLPPGSHTVGIAPSILELSQQSGDYAAMIESSRKQGDLLAYATALLFARGEGELPETD